MSGSIGTEARRDINEGLTRSAGTAETLEAYCARRAHAYAVGEAKARRREIGADAYLFLYKELVGLAGERTYCWPGLEFLQERLETSSGTLKRWIKELEHADLIRRKPRPGGRTSLTYITAYLQIDVTKDVQDEEVAAPPATLFFGPDQQIISDRGAGSDAIPHSVKNQESKNRIGGGGRQDQNRHNQLSFSREMSVLLQDEQVLDPDAAREIQAKPAEEIEAISRYLDGQTNIRSRPALFVWLARRDFGALLLKTDRSRSGHRKSDKAASCLTPEAAAPMAHKHSHVWPAVLERLRRAAEPNEYATWLEPTRLVDLDGDTAVVGTPNIFVRDEIERRYKAECTAHLADVVGRPCTMELVIVTPRAP